MDARDDTEVVADWIRITSDEYGDPAPSVVDAIVEGRALDDAWAWSLSETPPDEHCHHFGHPPWHHTRHKHRAHPKMWVTPTDARTSPDGLHPPSIVRDPLTGLMVFDVACRCVSDPVIPWEE